jgi:hypothetical protein
VGRVKPFRYSVEIETWGPPPERQEALEALAEGLESLGAGGAATSVGGLAGGIGATFSVDVKAADRSDSAIEAVRRAVEVFEAACERVGIAHGGIARADSMTDTYLDRYLEEEPERYAGVSEVAALIGVSRQRVSELRAKPGFPAPVAELSAGPIWKVSSLNRFLREWERRPGRPRRSSPAAQVRR